MTRKHRSAHRLLWTFLALAIAFGFSIALLLRAPATTQADTSVLASEVHS